MEVSDRPVKRQKIRDGSDVSDATPDHSGLREMILATRRDTTAGPRNETHKIVCLDQYPQLTELMYAAKLQHFSCRIIENMVSTCVPVRRNHHKTLQCIQFHKVKH
jgi:hypothetical protein